MRKEYKGRTDSNSLILEKREEVNVGRGMKARDGDVIV